MERLLSTRAGIAVAVAAGVLAAALVSLAVTLAGWSGEEVGETVPRGWEWVDRAVTPVWLVLFGCMGAAAWLAYRAGGPSAARDGRAVLLLLAACALYPVYTLGFQRVPGLIGNIAVLALTAWVGLTVRRSSRAAALLIVPVGAWVVVATVYVVLLIAANPP